VGTFGLPRDSLLCLLLDTLHYLVCCLSLAATSFALLLVTYSGGVQQQEMYRLPGYRSCKSIIALVDRSRVGNLQWRQSACCPPYPSPNTSRLRLTDRWESGWSVANHRWAGRTADRSDHGGLSMNELRWSASCFAYTRARHP
jgi:hypothetical protein